MPYFNKNDDTHTFKIYNLTFITVISVLIIVYFFKLII